MADEKGVPPAFVAPGDDGAPNPNVEPGAEPQTLQLSCRASMPARALFAVFDAPEGAAELPPPQPEQLAALVALWSERSGLQSLIEASAERGAAGGQRGRVHGSCLGKAATVHAPRCGWP